MESKTPLTDAIWDHTNPEKMHRIMCDLELELSAVRRDAERYRWLRDSGQAVSAWQDLDGVHWSIGGPKGTNVLSQNLDEAVDAAAKGGK